MTKSEHSKESQEPKESTAASEKKKKKSRWPKRVGYSALVVVGILVVAVGTEVVGYYRYNFDDPFTMRTVTILPFPAATIGKHVITVNNVMENERALTQFFKTDRNLDLADPENREAKQDVRKSVLDRMIEDVVVRDLAIQNNIVVTDDDVQKQVDEIKSQISEGQNLSDALQQLYGWSEQEFVNRVVRPQAQLAKLQELYNNNDALTGDARTKAEDVLAKVKEPNADFAALAKEFSEDTGSASAGGDLGTVGSGVFVPEFEDAARALEPGQVSEIVRTSFGFHIIKLVAKDDKTFHAQHILIKTDFQGWLDDQKRTFDIRVPLEDFTWDQEAASVAIVDLDRDGKPDAQDDDDDNDGFTDSEEQAADSDPLNHSSVPQSDSGEEQTQEAGSGTTTDGAAQ